MKKNLFDRNLKIEITTDDKKLTVKEDKIIIAGPCAIESYDQLLKTAKFVKSKGANILRGGHISKNISKFFPRAKRRRS